MGQTRLQPGKGRLAVALSALAASLLLAALALPASAQAAPLPQLWTSCFSVEGGSGANECDRPVGVAADPNTPGHVYIADSSNHRIDEFNAWGAFVKSWGWGVADGSLEPQTCGPGATPPTASCRAGIRDFEGGGVGGGGQLSTANGVAVDSAGDVYAVDSSRIQKFGPAGEFLRAWGAGVVSGGATGTGDLSVGSDLVTSLAVTGKEFRLGQTITGAGIPAGTVITAFGQGQIRLSKPATASGSGVALTVAEGAGNVPTDEQQTVTIEGAPTGGSFTLTTTSADIWASFTAGSDLVQAVPTSFNFYNYGTVHVGDSISILGGGLPAGTIEAIDTANGVLDVSVNATGTGASRLTATETTAPIAYDAPASGAGSVQGALEALPNVGAGNVTVTGPAGGPYTVTFQGPLLGDVDVAEMGAGGSGLTPAGTVEVETAAEGAGAAEVCTVAADCQGGITGDEPGQFGRGPVSSFIAIDHGGTLGDAADDVVYVGDTDRIQRFDAEGAYLGEIELPEEGQVGSLAVDQASGDLYFAYDSDASTATGEAVQPDVHRLDPATGEITDTLAVAIPTAIATAPDGSVYVFDQRAPGGECCNPGNFIQRVLKFDAAGNLVEVSVQNEGPNQFESDQFTRGSVGGLAIGSACFAGAGHDLYATNTGGTAKVHAEYVRAFGPPPDDPACPPDRRAPSIEAAYAVSVGITEARLEALVNPHFFSGAQGATRYFVQYATAACIEAQGWEGECVAEHPAPPGVLLKGGVVDAALPAPVLLSGLEPDTAYRFRFAAESKDSEGAPTVEPQPVFGVGGTPGEEGEERSFRTFAEPAGSGPCPNDAFRTGPSAALPDCRAYELVSPLDKANGDIATPLPTGLQADLARHIQAAASGGALTYSSYRAFADTESAPYSSQYLARRTPGGWTTENVSAPQEGPEFGLGLQGLGTLYRYFSEELTEGWIQTATDPVLAPGAQQRRVNVYRRDNASGAFEACTTAPSLSPEPTDFREYLAVPQGISAGGEVAIFRANDKLTLEASEGKELDFGVEQAIDQLYACARGESGEREVSLASLLPAGVASDRSSTAGESGEQDRYGRSATLAGALSEDGSRLYWKTGGRLYLRENPAEEQSEQEHGSAQGKGDTIGPALGTGRTFKAGTTITSVEVEEGAFAAGQEVTAKCPEKGGTEVLAAGTTITLAGSSLKISPAALDSCLEAEIVGHPSATVFGIAAGFGAFAAGQGIEGAGIAPGTTIVAVDGGKATLTLSDPATETGKEVALEAFSECVEPAKACTYAVSPAGSDASFRAARPDGSAALFVQDGALWRFEAASGEANQIAVGVAGLAGWSADLSRVYLASTSAEPGGEPVEPNARGDLPLKGAPNLYLHEAGAGGGGFTFIGTLAASEGPPFERLSPIAREPNYRIARVTPDGARLALTTTARLTDYDNTDRLSGEPAAEVYLYDADTGELLCASCNPAGGRPVARLLKRSRFANDDPILAAAHIPPWINSFHATRALSDDGSRLYFNSEDPLALDDTNGHRDVYQWEEPGSGDCAEEKHTFSAQNGGCVELISSGKSPADSEFFDADRTGTDVFFATAQSLAPQDPGLIDVYDAREGGGFPQPAEVAPCEGEACQGLVAAPDDPTPASAAFEGAGNVVVGPAATKGRCAKGKVRRKGRCVKAQRKRAAKHPKRAQRHHHSRSAGR